MLNARLNHVLFVLLFGLSACGNPAPEAPPLAGARMGGPFSLTGETGAPVKESDFKGQYRLVYFGYTFCPDVCPVDVQSLMQGFKAFEKSDPDKASKVQPIFITVDPARDTPAVLTQFTDAFHPRLLGLTGDAATIASVTKAYGGYAQRGDARPDGGYLVDHTRSAVLYGPEGQPLAIIKQDAEPQSLAAELTRWVK